MHCARIERCAAWSASPAGARRRGASLAKPAILLKDKRCASVDAQTRGLMHREPMRQQ